MKYTHSLTGRLTAYLMGSVGPHYISLKTVDQASGFIFADTVGAGFYYRITESSAINIGYRFRHASNAGLKMPNGGINTNFCTVGYSVFF